MDWLLNDDLEKIYIFSATSKIWINKYGCDQASKRDRDRRDKSRGIEGDRDRDRNFIRIYKNGIKMDKAIPDPG